MNIDIDFFYKYRNISEFNNTVRSRTIRDENVRCFPIKGSKRTFMTFGIIRHSPILEKKVSLPILEKKVSLSFEI